MTDRTGDRETAAAEVDVASLQRSWSRIDDDGNGVACFRGQAAELATAARHNGQPRVAELAMMIEVMCDPVAEGEEPVTREFASIIDNYLKALQQIGEADATGGERSPQEHTSHGEVYLLADQRLTDAQDIRRQLAHFGYQVTTVADHDALMGEMKRAIPLAVVIDHDHVADGVALDDIPGPLRQAGGENLPIVMVSSRGDMATRLQAARAGIQVYLVKPFSPHDLIDQLEQFAPATPPEPLNILLVEDSRTQAMYFSDILEGAGMQVYVEADPLHVLNALEDRAIDLILMDMYMPHCNGHELARVVRQVPRYASIPIVFLSSETKLERQLDAMSRGGDDFLTKPIEAAHLIRSVTIRAERARTLRSLMVTDNLTGLLNHTCIKEELENEVSRTERRGGQLAFIMLDIDRFKSVNDTHGHPVGDMVIRSLARLLQQRLRRSDAIGRYGGEEFAIIMPDASSEQAASILDGIRRSFASLSHDGAGGSFSVTFSAGVAGFPALTSPDDLTAAADAALYRAKHQGRNRIVQA